VKRKATEDISSRPAKIIKNELFASNGENLKPSDITSLCQALYRERQNKFPKLPSSIEEVSDVLNFLKPINTSKDPVFFPKSGHLLGGCGLVFRTKF
jgi:hypothetical protein